MSSKVELCSNALILLGLSPIASLTESSDRAIVMANLYDQVRRASIRLHIWNFAQEAVQLSPSSTTPLGGWSYQFTLPGDCLRVLWGGEEGEHPEYRMRGRRILANESSFLLEYLKDIEDANTFDALFADYLCANLAFTGAYPLTKSETLQKACFALMGEKLKMARAIDGQEEPPRSLDYSPILNARRSGGYPSSTP